MTFSDDYRTFGDLAVAEKEIPADCKETVEAEIAIFALGWESRCCAIEHHVVLKAKKVIALDFALLERSLDAVEQSRATLMSFAEACGAQYVELKLLPSVEYQKNINVLGATLSSLAQSEGSYYGTFRKVFVDCTTMPRIYIQWLVAHAFKTASIQSLEFGYAQGDYSAKPEIPDFASGVSAYVTVPLLQGGGGIGEEKLLVVGIGGDADVFYGLIDEFSPERIALLVPRSKLHPSVDGLLDQQIANVRETHRLQSDEITETDAFGIHSHLDAFLACSKGFGTRAVISVFVGGPKVQAIASAIFACSDRRVQVKARIPKSYPLRDVVPNGKYNLFRIVDLTSPACSLPDMW
jgi:hypothetical protein